LSIFADPQLQCPPVPSADTSGRYRIERLLASGGMGDVYRARMSTAGGLEKPIALKIVREELASDPHFVEMFVDEARVVMSMSHANVVQAFDVGRIDDRWFIAMEFVEGMTLGELAREHQRVRGEPMPPEVAVTAIVEALKGLDYAHRRKDERGELLGVVHRDISPSNVLVSTEGEVKLTDFGIAKSEERAAESIVGAIKGKILYMAPEQLRGSTVNLRADVYAMGVVLFELLAGRRPYVGSDTVALIPDILAGRREKLGEVAKAVPPQLASVVERALAIDPEGRFPSAAAMRQALEEVARASGWILASTDLADLMLELGDAEGESELVSALAPRDSGGLRAPLRPPRVSRGRDETGPLEPEDDATTTPSSDRFALLLGQEMRRVATDEPVSVFVTRTPEVEAGIAPPAAAKPATATSSSVHLPASRAPRAVVAGIVAVTLVAITWIALGGSRGEEAVAASEPEAETAPETEPDSVSDSDSVSAFDSVSVSASASDSVPVPDSDSDSASEPVPVPVPVPGRSPPRTHRPPPPAVATPTATLWVASEPWGWVYVDGERVGRTTLRAHTLPAGAHELRVENPAGGLERRVSITLAPGETRRLSIDLAESAP
jgi:serine/threonine-protein kinase